LKWLSIVLNRLCTHTQKSVLSSAQELQLTSDSDFLLFGAIWPTKVVEITVTDPPNVTLPDLAHVEGYEAVVRAELGELVADPIDGVEIVACDADQQATAQAEGGAISQEVDDSLAQLEIDDAGAGRFYSLDTDSLITISVGADGTGEYFHESPGRLTTLKVAPDGAGEYFDRVEGDEAQAEQLVTITVDSDGTVRFFAGSENRVETVEVRTDGSAEHFLEVTDGSEAAVTTTTSTRRGADGAWESRKTIGGNFTEVVVQADGSGTYADSTIGRATFDQSGLAADAQFIAPRTPMFDVAVNFPKLGSLGRLAATCESVIRVDESLLFASGSAEVSNEGAAVLSQLVATLNDHGQGITIAGHTDAIGDEPDNLNLSTERAETVRSVMAVQGLRVATDVIGYGESQPLAENYLADGSLNVEGMALNRRVEIHVDG